MGVTDSVNDLIRGYLNARFASGVLAPEPVYQAPMATSPALAPYTNEAVTDKVLVSNAWRRVYWYNVHNPNAAVAFLQFHDAAAAAGVTLGSSSPTHRFSVAIPAGAVTDGALSVSPAAFPNGIVVAATTTSKGSTLVGAGLPVSIAGV